MKKSGSLFLIICLLTGALSACATGQNVDQALLKRNVALAEQLTMRAQEPAYLAMLSGYDMLTKPEEIAKGVDQTPRAVFGIEIEAETMLQTMLQDYGIDTLSEPVKEQLARRMLAGIPQQINGMAGVETLAMASVLTIEECFVEKGLQKPLLCISLYSGEWATAVCYRPGEDGAINATATFIYSASFSEIQTPEQLQNWLASMSYVQPIVRQML